MSVKDTKAEVNTITYDKDKIEDKVGSIYEAIVIMGKRAEQINAEIRTELHNKLDEFAVHNSTLEEVFENREQIEISKHYEKLPKPTSIAIEEWLNEDVYNRREKVIFCILINQGHKGIHFFYDLCCFKASLCGKN